VITPDVRIGVQSNFAFAVSVTLFKFMFAELVTHKSYDAFSGSVRSLVDKPLPVTLSTLELNRLFPIGVKLDKSVFAEDAAEDVETVATVYVLSSPLIDTIRPRVPLASYTNCPIL
jgi:hypothetical protein